MNIHCNAGIASTNWVGYFEVFGTVWHHKEGIENILLMEKVQANYHVTYDNQDGNAFLVDKPNGQAYSFSMLYWGVYYLNTTANNALI